MFNPFSPGQQANNIFFIFTFELGHEMQTMKKNFITFYRASVLVLIAAMVFAGCKKDENPSNIILPKINISINPNSTLYQQLNVVGGWTYLGYGDGVIEPSRGIIVYRFSTQQFMAYDRIPPYKPDSCCSGDYNCTRLVVENYYPFVMDTCTQSKYLLIDGSPTEGPSTLPLLYYQTTYDGNTLFIYN
jgi:hypothetical protein